LITAFSPGQITGFFSTHSVKDPLLTGSIGAGICIQKGVKTTVNISPSQKFQLNIFINKFPCHNAKVSNSVVQQLIGRSDKKFSLTINHYLDIPIKCGYGSSGAAALSLSYALNEALNLGLSKTEAAQVAHIAEVRCKTGLGTVLGAYHGGLQIRLQPGAPGIGKTSQIPINDKKIVATFTLGQLSTTNLLLNSSLIKSINNTGDKYLIQLLNKPNYEYFLHLSRQFALMINFFPLDFFNFMKLANRFDMICSMNLFGNSLFSILSANELTEFYNLFLKSKLYGHIFFSNINYSGAKIV